MNATTQGFVMCAIVALLTLCTNAAEKRSETICGLMDALSKVKACSAYRLSRSLEADLAPGSSGVMVPVRITESAVTVVAYTGGVIRAQETSVGREGFSWLRLFSRGNKQSKTTVWDDQWIYTWNGSGSGMKMLNTEANRGAALVESLYSALANDESTLFRGEESVDGQPCIMLESSAEILVPFLYVPGKATILISKRTGFPVRISSQNQESKAVVNYKSVEPIVANLAERFTVPSNVVFEAVRGQE